MTLSKSLNMTLSKNIVLIFCIILFSFTVCAAETIDSPGESQENEDIILLILKHPKNRTPLEECLRVTSKEQTLNTNHHCDDTLYLKPLLVIEGVVI